MAFQMAVKYCEGEDQLSPRQEQRVRAIHLSLDGVILEVERVGPDVDDRNGREEMVLVRDGREPELLSLRVVSSLR